MLSLTKFLPKSNTQVLTISLATAVLGLSLAIPAQASVSRQLENNNSVTETLVVQPLANRSLIAKRYCVLKRRYIPGRYVGSYVGRRYVKRYIPGRYVTREICH